MFNSRSLLILLGFWLLLPAVALGQTVGVVDGAGYLKPETIRTANEQIEQIQRLYQVNVLIETVGPLSDDLQNEFKKIKDPVARDQFFLERAEKRAKHQGANGIYVWICKFPFRVEVVVSPDVSEEIFSAKNRKDLRDQLTKRFAKHSDRELLLAVKQIQNRLDSATQPAIWPYILGIIALVLVIWAVIGLVRRRSPEDTPPTGHPTPGAAPFGAAGGLWIHHPLPPRKSSPDVGAPKPTPPPLPPPPLDRVEDDFTEENSEADDYHSRSDGKRE